MGPLGLPCVGVIMLDTGFPRPVGDIGNPLSFAERVAYEKVPAATLDRVVMGDPRELSLLDGFVTARDRLVAAGGKIITTSCGLLVFHQTRLQQGCPVPFTASALFQIPLRQAQLGGRVGVIGLQAAGITPAHLVAVGAPADTPVAGLPEDGHLLSVLRANDPTIAADPDRASAELLGAGRALMAQASDLGGIVLECTNLRPYRTVLDRALDIPVFDYMDWLVAVNNKEAAVDGTSPLKGFARRTYI